MIICKKSEIQEAISIPSLFEKIENSFCLYSQGKSIVPPVGQMRFDQPQGDLCIKYGHIPGENYYAVKIASYFPENSKIGLSAIQGMIGLFCQKSGLPVALLLDDGYLTNLRTAIAGAICAKYLAPKGGYKIGILGAGTQAKAQLQMLKHVTENREVFVWARNPAEALRYQSDLELREFEIQTSPTLEHLAQNCKLIVTTTPSSTPLLRKEHIVPGTHITAVGADRPGKQELDPELFSFATRVVVDSRAQCFSYGDTSHALKANAVSEDKILELGEIIENASLRRQSNREITIADLTGLGVQDLKIAEGVFEKLLKPSESSERRIII